MAVTKLEIAERGALAGGKPFGEAGPYEYLSGTMHFAVDARHPANQAITDLALAPAGPDGRVRFSSDFALLKPVNARAAGRLLYDVVNRGNKGALPQFNYAPRGNQFGPEMPLGDGFLLRHGFSIVWCGWQHDVPTNAGQMAIHIPEATGPSGERLSGATSIEIQPWRATQVLALADRGHQPVPVQDVDDPRAVLRVRENSEAPARTVERSQWRFARLENGRPVADPGHVYLASGFEPGKVYEVIYTTAGAPVIGLGLLSTRDCIAFLRHGTAEAGNPCAGAIRHTYAYGASQTGRYLRELLFWGLNEDEEGRQVLDGVHPHTASSRRGEFNMRFGQPSGNILRAPGNLFPLTYTAQPDPVTGEKGGLLDRLPPGRMPKIVATNSGIEYWWSGASLGHTDVTGKTDVEPPDNVRIYYLAGTQHGAGDAALTSVTEEGVRTVYPHNTLDYRPMVRAALLNLVRWVEEGREPPPSRYPRVGDGTGVPRESLAGAFESLGIRFPSVLPRRKRLDFGPEMARGIPAYPAQEGEPYGTIVSAVDGDGNDVAGVRYVDLLAPLATLTGWNLRHPDIGAEGETMCGFANPLLGATHAFPRTEEERRARSDPRRSIAERYGSREGYVAAVRAAVEGLVKDGYVLAEDLERAVVEAGRRYDVIMGS